MVLLSSEEDLKKIDGYHINDTVCIDGPLDLAVGLAEKINSKHKVAIKIVTQGLPPGNTPEEVEVINSPIKEIVGEGRAEAVKFQNGKAVGVCLVVFMDKSMSAVFERDQEKGSFEPLAQLGINGADNILELSRQALEKAVNQRGQEANVEFSGTDYYLPLIYALLNIEVKTLADCQLVLSQSEKLIRNEAALNGLSIYGLGGGLNKGLASLFCAEILVSIAASQSNDPDPGTGFIPDKVLRSLGLQLVDGRISGIAVILGPARDEESAAGLIRDFQSRGIVSLLAGSVNGLTFRRQLEKAGIRTGLENYIIELGEDCLSVVYALDFASRAPLIYGGNKPGQWELITDYLRNRLPAFILLLGHVDETLAAECLGAMSLGFPVITDLDIPQIPRIETTLFEALVTEKDYRKIPGKCVLTRGVKARICEPAIPVPYSSAFEGERVRKEQLAVEFGGKAGPALELLGIKSETEVEDGRVELNGIDIEYAGPQADLQSLAIVVDVFGRKMQKDFEPVLERQINRFINYCAGVMHAGQRDLAWIRISREAFEKGFRLKHLGVVLHAMLHQEYGAIVDKVQVRIYTGRTDVDRLIADARKVFDERDERLDRLTDESVDTFYSCTLCQSLAPNHVCMLTPERPGLCGAYSWLDAKASFEIVPTGPNQPVQKGGLLDERLGQWEGINKFVYEKSNKSIKSVSLYSLMRSPQSSCGLFECIAVVVPEANGVMVVNREYPGLTPSGMNFSALAGLAGGGMQVPGFLGISKIYISSGKFISAEGGLRRIVWMPRELKGLLAERLKKRAREIGEFDLLDKIADETVAVNSEELLDFLRKAGHPALSMEPVI
ncbi:MAG: acetyl-CoA decarbonylase/synthase complex subunit alpha/beta [Candidatus Omnitrophica bacterium]|nr:acetyl-CoA decarbonylase/synthase complex subunit alpha/beta [Candidatus Omnitrophota bacterium]